jgi:hypothetical protein
LGKANDVKDLTAGGRASLGALKAVVRITIAYHWRRRAVKNVTGSLFLTKL